MSNHRGCLSDIPGLYKVTKKLQYDLAFPTGFTIIIIHPSSGQYGRPVKQSPLIQNTCYGGNLTLTSNIYCKIANQREKCESVLLAQFIDMCCWTKIRWYMFSVMLGLPFIF